MPRARTRSSGLQQSSSSSLNHRHGPRHSRPGSTPSALRVTTSVPSPQKAGSACVWNCSIKGKKDSMPPAERAASNRARPSGEAKAISAGGKGRRYRLSMTWRG